MNYELQMHNLNVYLDYEIRETKKILEQLQKDLTNALKNKYTNTDCIYNLVQDIKYHIGQLDSYINTKDVLNIEKGKKYE